MARWCYKVKEIWVNTGTGNGWLPVGTKPLHGPMSTLSSERSNRIHLWGYFDGLVHDCSGSSALAMESPQSCTKPSNNGPYPTGNNPHIAQRWARCVDFTFNFKYLTITHSVRNVLVYFFSGHTLNTVNVSSTCIVRSSPVNSSLWDNS